MKGKHFAAGKGKSFGPGRMELWVAQPPWVVTLGGRSEAITSNGVRTVVHSSFLRIWSFYSLKVFRVVSASSASEKRSHQLGRKQTLEFCFCEKNYQHRLWETTRTRTTTKFLFLVLKNNPQKQPFFAYVFFFATGVLPVTRLCCFGRRCWTWIFLGSRRTQSQPSREAFAEAVFEWTSC